MTLHSSTPVSESDTKEAILNAAEQLFAAQGVPRASLRAITGEAGNGSRSTFGVDPRENPAAQDVVQRFRDSGYEPEGYTLHTYAAVEIWAQATQKARSLDPAVVIEVMKSNDFDTVLGTIRFDAKPGAARSGSVCLAE